jgi:cysteine-rich repeat protein
MSTSEKGIRLRFLGGLLGMGLLVDGLMTGCHSGSQRDIQILSNAGASDGSVDAALIDGSTHPLRPDGSFGAGAGGMNGAGGLNGTGGTGGTNPDLLDGGLDATSDGSSNDADADDGPHCGDGSWDVALDEECDDGNGDHSDGCEVDCTKTTIEQIAIGIDFTCALSGAGGVKCWGMDTYGSLAQGTTGNDLTDPLQAELLDFGTDRRVVQITARYYHACALFEDGKARCWGQNAYGQLGRESTANYGDGPNELLKNSGDINLSNIEQIVAGYRNTCAILETGSLYCWGYNNVGNLGIGSTQQFTYPSTPTVLDAIPTSLMMMNQGMCTSLTGGTARCWGSQAYGMLGVGTINHRIGDGQGDGAGEGELPDDPDYNVKGLPGPLSAMGAGFNTGCTVVDGDVYCWGLNSVGQAGYPTGTYGTEVWQTPRAVNLGVVNVVQLAVGWGQVCAVDDEGVVRCWGGGGSGQTGYPGGIKVGYDQDPVDDYLLMDAADSGFPDAGRPPGLPLGAVDVGDFEGELGLDPAVKVVAGHDATCAQMQTGGWRCWGDNALGRLGYDPNQATIGYEKSPAATYEDLGYADIKVFGPSE